MALRSVKHALRASAEGILSRDLGKAAAAFEEEDALASKRAHKIVKIYIGKYFKTVLFSGCYGLITSLIILATLSGLNEMYNSLAIYVSSIVLIANAIGVGLFAALSRQEDKDFYAAERRECKNYLKGEQEEMVELYERKGMPLADAEAVVKIISKDPKIFVDIMMLEELRMVPVQEVPTTAGLVAFCAHVAFGIWPLLPGLLSLYFNGPEKCVLHPDIATILSFVILFAIGTFKGLLHPRPWWVTAVSLVAVGVAGFSSASLFARWAVSSLLPPPMCPLPPPTR